jgi:hypothetical protein
MARMARRYRTTYCPVDTGGRSIGLRYAPGAVGTCAEREARVMRSSGAGDDLCQLGGGGREPPAPPSAIAGRRRRPPAASSLLLAMHAPPGADLAPASDIRFDLVDTARSVLPAHSARAPRDLSGGIHRSTRRDACIRGAASSQRGCRRTAARRAVAASRPRHDRLGDRRFGAPEEWPKAAPVLRSTSGDSSVVNGRLQIGFQSTGVRVRATSPA